VFQRLSLITLTHRGWTNKPGNLLTAGKKRTDSHESAEMNSRGPVCKEGTTWGACPSLERDSEAGEGEARAQLDTTACQALCRALHVR